jgi:hypothetical protein
VLIGSSVTMQRGYAGSGVGRERVTVTKPFSVARFLAR